MTSSFLNWCLSNNSNWNKALPLFLSHLPCCFLHCAESPSDGNSGILRCWFVRGKGRTPPFLSMQSACSPPVMIFCGGLLGRKTCDWKITVILLFCVCFFLLLHLLSQCPFPQVPVLRLADRRIVCLPREINSLFFVNSFQNQMLIHHILVIKQITSGAAEHSHKLCLVLPSNIR